MSWFLVCSSIKQKREVMIYPMDVTWYGPTLDQAMERVFMTKLELY
jgi:hypothetical protein